MTTEHPTPAPEEQGITPARPRMSTTGRVIVALLAVVVAFLMYTQINTKLDANEATHEAEAVQERAEDAASQVDQLCAEDGAVAEELERRGACEKAREVLDAPPPEPVAVGPSREDIETAVADWLAEHPPPAGRPPTVAEITAAVADYLTAHPPRLGRPPTPTEIATAVADYLTAHPPPAGPAGADGENGGDGPPPTAEQIAAAVNEWLTANPPSSGPPGPPGPTGPAGPPGPICPDGYELRTVVAVAPDGGTYTDALLCVRPDSKQPPDPDPPPGGLLPGG